MGHSARFLYFVSPFPDLSVRGARASGTWPLSEEWSGDSRALNPIGRRWASEEKGRTGEISGSAIPGARVTKTNGRLGIAPHCCVADDAAVRERKKKSLGERVGEGESERERRWRHPTPPHQNA